MKIIFLASFILLIVLKNDVQINGEDDVEYHPLRLSRITVMRELFLKISPIVSEMIKESQLPELLAVWKFLSLGMDHNLKSVESNAKANWLRIAKHPSKSVREKGEVTNLDHVMNLFVNHLIVLYRWH